MPNPEASNSNQAGSDSTLGGRTTGKGGGQNPFQSLEDMPKFEDHMAKIEKTGQNTSDISEQSRQENLDSLTTRLIDRDLQNGLSSDEVIANNLSIYDIPKYLDFLESRDIKVDLDELVPKLDSLALVEGFDQLEKRGVEMNADKLASDLESEYGADAVAEHLDTLVSHNAQIDANKLIQKLSPRDIADNLDSLINHGAEIEIDHLVNELWGSEISDNLDSLLRHGASYIAALKHGATKVEDLGVIIDSGVSPNDIIPYLDGLDLYGGIDKLKEYGADIDIDHVVAMIGAQSPLSLSSSKLITDLLNRGASANNILRQLNPNRDDTVPSMIAENLNTFLDHGADPEKIINILPDYEIVDKIDTLLSRGVNAQKIADHLEPGYLSKVASTLSSYGAKV